MGWASGSELAEDLWILVRKYIPENKRKGVARKFVDCFESQDCDTMQECEKLMADAEIKYDDE